VSGLNTTPASGRGIKNKNELEDWLSDTTKSLEEDTLTTKKRKKKKITERDPSIESIKEKSIRMTQ